jgi:hypothetical protein
MVVINPRSNPKLSSSTFTTGARQLVVQLALETTWWLAASYLSWLTPRTMVMSSPLAGALMITFLAPASRCLAALARSVNRPVLSMTMSTSRSRHGRADGSFSAYTRISSPSTSSEFSRASTVPGYLPCTES